MPEIKSTQETSTFSFRMANMTAPDALFLGEVCSLFCDPSHAENLRLLRLGRVSLRYDHATGRLLIHRPANCDHAKPSNFGRN